MTSLEKSIQHWSNLLHGKETLMGRDDCDLCAEYWANGCVSCPVYKKTGKTACNNTPYIFVVGHTKRCHGYSHSVVSKCLTCKRLIKKELDFLKSLRE